MIVTIHLDRQDSSEHVECGGLPPLFAARACPGVLLAFNRRSGSGEASLARRQRRQAAALHIGMRRIAVIGDYNFL